MGEYDNYVHKIVKVTSTSDLFKRDGEYIFGRLYPEHWIQECDERGYTLRVIVSDNNCGDCYLTPTTLKDANLRMTEATPEEMERLLCGLKDTSLRCSEGCWMIEALKMNLQKKVH